MLCHSSLDVCVRGHICHVRNMMSNDQIKDGHTFGRTEHNYLFLRCLTFCSSMRWLSTTYSWWGWMLGSFIESHLKSTINSNFVACSALVHHDNARLTKHMQQLNKFTNLHLECLTHLLYSPDLTLCDYPMFEPLKKALRGKSSV